MERGGAEEQPRHLQLLGAGGFGKSLLTSGIIESFKRRPLQQEQRMPRLVYFVCKAGDNAVQQGIRIMLYLVSQLFANATADIKKANG